MTWPTKKLGEVAKYINGKAFKPSDWSDSGLPIIRIQNLTGTQDDFNYYNGDLEKRYIVERDDILLSWSASLGVYLWGKQNAALNQHIFKVLALSGVDKKYLFYILHLAVEDLKKRVHGSTMTHITKGVLDRVSVPVPPIEIQKQIVGRMDKIAEAQKLNDELIQKSDELFQSLLHQELNTENSRDWKIEKLEEIIVDTTNGFASRPVAKGVGQLRPNNIDSKGTLNFLSIKFVPESYRNIKDYFLKKDDILFNNTNSVALVGKTTCIDKDYDYAFSNHMTRIRVDGKRVDPQFFAIFLQRLYSMGKFRFLCTPWVNQSAVNTTALKRLKISLPQLGTQKQIVAKLSAVQEHKKLLVRQKELLKELFNSVLDKCIKGELVN